MFSRPRLLRVLQFCKCSTKRDLASTQQHFITVPIFYVNSSPHIGHLYSVILADAIQRWKSFEKTGLETSIFAVGTDEHGRKVEQAARASGKTNEEHCMMYSEEFRRLFQKFDISFNVFTRTSSAVHKETVCRVWKHLMDLGLIYKSSYEGWYSVIDECFYSSSEIEERDSVLGAFISDEEPLRVAKETQSPVEWIHEQNYRFRLGEFTQDIRRWLERGDVIHPAQYLSEALTYFPLDGSPLSDLSISRPANRCQWAISVPGDSEQTIYVWFDALCSYLTSANYKSNESSPGEFIWPPDVQVLGKDILRFHAIYWPAFLLALFNDEKALPKKLFVHGHWLVNKAKMSKSKGNVVRPLDAVDELGANEIGTDNLRYFLLRHGNPCENANFTISKALTVINAELVDDLANLVQRSFGPKINPQNSYPILPPENFSNYGCKNGSALIGRLQNFREIVGNHFSCFDFHRGLEWIAETVRLANGVFHTSEPWKKPADSDEVRSTIFLALETARLSALFLQPIVPNYSRRILDRLTIPTKQRALEAAYFDECGELLAKRIPLNSNKGSEPPLVYSNEPIWPRLKNN